MEKTGDEKLAQRIKELRARNNKMTQKQLASFTNLSEQMIRKIESGERFISRDTAKRLADAFGVSIEFILSGKEDKPKSRIPDLQPDIELTPEQLVQLEYLRARGLLYSKPYFATLSNRQLLEIIENATSTFRDRQETGEEE